MLKRKTKKKSRKKRRGRRRERKKNSINRYLFGASIRNPEKGLILSSKNKKARESRMQMIPILEWCRSNVVLTMEELGECRHPWGNCSESVPWHALTGRR